MVDGSATPSTAIPMENGEIVTSQTGSRERAVGRRGDVAGEGVTQKWLDLTT